MNHILLEHEILCYHGCIKVYAIMDVVYTDSYSNEMSFLSWTEESRISNFMFQDLIVCFILHQLFRLHSLIKHLDKRKKSSIEFRSIKFGSFIWIVEIFLFLNLD